MFNAGLAAVVEILGGIVPGGTVGCPAKPEYTLDTSGVAAVGVILAPSCSAVAATSGVAAAICCEVSAKRLGALKRLAASYAPRPPEIPPPRPPIRAA